jgi:hypothetical protein
MERFRTKKPSESYHIEFDFSDVPDLVISSAVVTAKLVSTGADATATIITAEEQLIIGTSVYVWVKAGTDGVDYQITCIATASGGGTHTLDGLMLVKEADSSSDGTTLNALINDIQEVLQDDSYDDSNLTAKINNAINAIAAGIRMPNGQISPPLPELYTYGVVNTSTLTPFVPLPINYHRGVFNVYDSSNYRIAPPAGGSYYAFNLFLRQIQNMALAESGSIYRVAVKGSKLYYQGIPTASTTLGVHYYRKPVDLSLDGDVPDGVPGHLQTSLIKHYVLKEIFGEAIEDGQDNRGIATKYHTGKFYEAMTDLVDFIGIDAAPEYYGADDVIDYGACDG